ncbi:MAG: STAS domain-containing protein [Solirubrobacteraceae bacterium]
MTPRTKSALAPAGDLPGGIDAGLNGIRGPDTFQVNTEVRDDYARLALCRELDLATAPGLEDELTRSQAADVRRIELDLSGLTFIGSAGLAAIRAANALAQDRGCEVALVRGPESVHRVFELTGLANKLPFVGESGSGEQATCTVPARERRE